MSARCYTYIHKHLAPDIHADIPLDLYAIVTHDSYTALTLWSLCVHLIPGLLIHSRPFITHSSAVYTQLCCCHPYNTQMCIHQSYTRIHIYHIRCRGLMTILVMCISCINSSHHYHIYIVQCIHVAGVLYSIIVYDHISVFTATILYTPNSIEISSLIS